MVHLDSMDGDGLGGGRHGVVVEVGHMEGEGDGGGAPASILHHQRHQHQPPFLPVQGPPRVYQASAPTLVSSWGMKK